VAPYGAIEDYRRSHVFQCSGSVDPNEQKAIKYIAHQHQHTDGRGGHFPVLQKPRYIEKRHHRSVSKKILVQNDLLAVYLYEKKKLMYPQYVIQEIKHSMIILLYIAATLHKSERGKFAGNRFSHGRNPPASPIGHSMKSD
jgi:hypothetical protein